MSQDEAPRRLARAEAVLASRRHDIHVVLEDAHDRHNISAVLRTCEAFGIQNVHLVVENDEPPQINSGVSLDAHRWLSVHQHEGARRTISSLREQGLAIFVGHLDADATPLPELPRDVRAAYVFGNEHHGVSEQWLAHADACFIIPTSGFSGSLNLSVAAALTIYDRLLGMASAALPPGNLTIDEKASLRARWYERLAHGSRDLLQRYRAFLSRPPEPEPHFPLDQHRPAPPWASRARRPPTSSRDA